MEQLGNNKIFGYYKEGQSSSDEANQSDIRRGTGYLVNSYLDLVAKIAEVQYLNPDFVLLLRGQSEDYKNPRGHSYIKSGIFRSPNGEYPGANNLREKFSKLRFAEKALVGNCQSRLVEDPKKRIERYRVVRWAILQHYEVVETPLLDVTLSLRVAASFASQNNKEEVYLFVLAVPNMSSAITSSADTGVQIIRLSSVCPPTAIRPHVQEGYLLGDYPEIDSFEQKSNLAYDEIDFGHRIISKFRFNPNTFWENKNFPKVPREFLYPSVDDDQFLDVIERVKEDLNYYPNFPQDRYGIGDSIFEVYRL